MTCITPVDELILKCRYPDPSSLFRWDKESWKLSLYKPPGAFSSIILHQPGSDSQLENQPPYYAVNSMSTHKMLFSVMG